MITLNSISKNNIAREISLMDLWRLNISIPVYQRPYKWTTEHTEDLLNDIQKAMNERPNVPYVMGTIIAHKKNDSDDFGIVDGQQRLTTLSILLEILKSKINSSLLQQEYKHVASKKNIVQNADHIQNWLFRKNVNSDLYDKWNEYLLNRLWFVLVLPPTMDEAFTFFDSQNNRGKRLEDYDLLKASHLRCIPKESDESKAVKCSQKWEELDKKRILKYLFQNLWGRTRTLSRKDSSEVNIKSEFKALMTSNSGNHYLNNYIQPPLFSAWIIDGNNGMVNFTLKTKLNILSDQTITIDNQDYTGLPFQLTKTIESGEPFFLFTQKYYQLYSRLFQNENKNNRVFKKLYNLISDFNNTGIGFLVEAFEAALIFYYDKFGNIELDEVALWLEHILFFKRLQMYSLRYSTVNNHLIAVNPFEIIEQSSVPGHVIESLIKCSESLFTQKSVKDFNFEKGIRKEYYRWMYAENGFFRLNDIQNYQRFFQAKKMIFDLKQQNG